MNHSNNDKNVDKQYCHRNEGLPVLGIFLVGLGSVFLLDRLHIIPHQLREIIISWQALLIFIGFANLFRSKSRFPGIVLILVGSAFLVPDIINIPFETRQLIWPLILIAIGLAIVFKARKIKHPDIFHSHDTSFSGSEKIDEVAIFGGGKRVVNSKNLRGGKIAAIFGGLEIDLTDAEIGGDVAVLEVAAIFGGATIIVRPEWDVQVQVTSILGGFSDERKIYKGDVSPNAKRLVIKGAAIFGGGEVKSY